MGPVLSFNMHPDPGSYQRSRADTAFQSREQLGRDR